MSRNVNFPRIPRIRGKDADIPLVYRMAVGSVAGCAGFAFTFPVDTAKTLMQGDAKSSAMQVIRNAWASGPRVFRGLGFAVGGTSVEKALKLAANDVAINRLTPNGEKVTVAKQILAGAVAGTAQALVAAPNEMIKLRNQSMARDVALGMKELSAIGVARDIYATGGVRGFYKGFTATLARDLPYNIIFFPVYSVVKAKLCADGQETMGRLIVSGAAAGSVAAFCGTPMDMIKTRLQSRGTIWSGSLAGYVRHIYATEGAAVFMRGALPRVAVQAPLYAIVMSAFELQKRYYLDHQN